MPKKDINIGITKEEIHQLILDAKIEDPLLDDAIFRMLQRNNELMLKYFEDNIYRIYNEKRETAMRKNGWKPPIKFR